MTSADQIEKITATSGKELNKWRIITNATFGYVESMEDPDANGRHLALIVIKHEKIDGTDEQETYYGIQPKVPEQFLTGLANLMTDSGEDAIALLTMWDVTLRALNSDHGDGCNCKESDG